MTTIQTIQTIVPTVVERARALGITLKLSSLRDAISYALVDQPYNTAAFSENSGKSIPIVLPPPHLASAASKYLLDREVFSQAFPAGDASSQATVVEAAEITFDLDNLRGGSRAPLWDKYPQQDQPQPAYVEMTEDGSESHPSTLGTSPSRRFRVGRGLAAR